EQAPLARLITQEAYKLGAAEVIVQWTDDQIQREFLLHAATDRKDRFHIVKHLIRKFEDIRVRIMKSFDRNDPTQAKYYRQLKALS
uniref:aminopeptidase n=1 Tax=Enterococcus faecium TaxID=1352 RepID=UPI00292D4E91